MTKPYPLTVHCMVRNEERFIWYALKSVLPYVEKVLVFDTGSTDRTVEVIKSINDPKIVLEEKGIVTKQDFYKLRQEQIERTRTPWILILDGDEIWPESAITELCEQIAAAPASTDAFVSRFVNFVDDVFHYQPESEGGYTIAGITGNLTVRAMRNIQGLHVIGDYGIEGFYDNEGKAMQERIEQIKVLDLPYLHASNLVRSSSLLGDWKIGYRRLKIFVGSTSEKREELDSVVRSLFKQPVPVIHYSPLKPDLSAKLVRGALRPLLKLRGSLRKYR